MYFCPKCDTVFDITNKPNTYQKGGATNQIDTIIKKIIKNKQLTNNDIKTLDYDDIIQSDTYKNLNNNKQQKIKTNLSKYKKDNLNQPFFICPKCGFKQKIQANTKIINRISDKVTELYSPNDYSNMKYSKILFNTRKYICPNDKCITHTQPDKKEAVFFRKNNTYQVCYICKACDTQF